MEVCDGLEHAYPVVALSVLIGSSRGGAVDAGVAAPDVQYLPRLSCSRLV